MTQRLVSILLAAVATFAVACGGDDDSSGDVADACRAVCDKQGQATGCGSLTEYLGACNAVCGVIVGQLDSDCRAKAQAAYECQAGLSYMCLSGGDVPLQTSAGCEAELDAYADCLPVE